MQSRLDIHSRMKSREEIDFEDRIRATELSIQEEKKRLNLTSKRLRKTLEEQQTRNLRLGEREVTEAYIRAEEKKIQDYIHRLQKDLIKLRQQTSKVQDASKKQSDMFQ